MIGIATFNKSINNGSVLQAWALQNVFKELGIPNEIIDYTPQHYDEIYSYFESWKSPRTAVRNLAKIPFYSRVKSQRVEYQEFHRRFLSESKEKYYCDSDFSVLNEKYSTIVCGSDQIWNTNIRDADPFYFMPMEHGARKIAYAISSNKADISQNAKVEEYKKWINDFYYISMREEKSANMIRTLLPHRHIEVQPDPTLLLGMDSYREICGDILAERPYIFLYCVAYRESTIMAAQKIGELLNRPVITMFPGKAITPYFMVTKAGFKVPSKGNGPQHFLNYIQNADCVITNSFHGTAFSIIFQKKFVCINDEKGKNQNVDDPRIMNILKEYGLEYRYIKREDIGTFSYDKTIDFEPITEKRMENARKVKDQIKTLVV